MTIRLGKTLAGKVASLQPKAFTTHAAVLGMTGSGKTGLLIGMAEEFVKNQIPTVLLDIKGDMINIALQQDMQLAAQMAVRCLTPGGDHGEPINIFAELENPDRVSFAVSALLKMIGEDPDPLKSRAHAYLSHILERRHARKQDVDLTSLVHAVQDPGFTHLGAMEVEFAFGRRSRTALAGKINNLLVAPAFQTWREGMKLRFDELLAPRPDGRTPVIVYSVAHLVDQDEQQFAIALLLNELLPWAKRQGGSGGELRTALIIDECMGLIPPHPKNPPTKGPLMQILKQARAFGLGAVLATQNPVDLDYKAMSNAESWFVGRLQMQKDKSRIIGNITSASTVDTRHAEKWVGALTPRQFLLVRPKGAVAFHTRDVTADLVGPMTPDELEEMYTTNRLVCRDQVALVTHRLHVARKRVMIDNSQQNVQRVASLEQQLSNLKKQQNSSKAITNQPFTVVNGGKQ